jgi:hypothetical protein
MGVKNHPVWDLYDEYRTARLSTLYYEKQLTVSKRWNLATDITLAATASSGVAGLWFWEIIAGGVVWEVILTIAALLAVTKPFINLAGQIQQKSELLAYWRSHWNDLNVLILLVKQHKSYTNKIRTRFISMMEAKKGIIQKEPPEKDEKLQERCYDRVNKELPFSDFFIPEE